MQAPHFNLRRSFGRIFAPLHRLVSGSESPRYLLKWVVLSTLIGIVAGIGAITFYAAIHLATSLFLGGLVGIIDHFLRNPGRATLTSEVGGGA